MLLTATNCIKSLEEKIQDQEIQIKNLRTELEKLNANKEIEAKDTEIQNNFTQCKKQSFLLTGWEPINTNIPENIGVGSQYWGVSIGVGGVLNKRIDQV